MDNLVVSEDFDVRVSGYFPVSDETTGYRPQSRDVKYSFDESPSQVRLLDYRVQETGHSFLDVISQLVDDIITPDFYVLSPGHA